MGLDNEYARAVESIEEKVINQIKERAKTGLNKYEVTMERQDLSLLDWVQHAQEEAMDLAVYLEKIKETLSKIM